MARWEEVIDHQVDLYNFWRSDMGRRYADGYLRSITGVDYLTAADKRAMINLHQSIPERAADFLFGADPIWVDPDMMTLVEGAAETFQSEPLHPEDVLTERGFLYLPRPHVSSDVHGKTVSIRAISWKVVHFSYRITDDNRKVPEDSDGLWLYLYHEEGDPDDYAPASEVHLPRLTLQHSLIWPFGQKYFDGMEADMNRYSAEAIKGLQSDSRFIGALFRLLNQTITVKAQHRPDRATRRRARALPEKHIVVVTLRRAREGTYQERGDSEPVEWSHRWLVTGHWRNQWFPSIGMHRQIWISPYIKGPEEKPLIVRPHHVYQLTR